MLNYSYSHQVIFFIFSFIYFFAPTLGVLCVLSEGVGIAGRSKTCAYKEGRGAEMKFSGPCLATVISLFVVLYCDEGLRPSGKYCIQSGMWNKFEVFICS